MGTAKALLEENQKKHGVLKTMNSVAEVRVVVSLTVKAEHECLKSFVSTADDEKRNQVPSFRFESRFGLGASGGICCLKSRRGDDDGIDSDDVELAVIDLGGRRGGWAVTMNFRWPTPAPHVNIPWTNVMIPTI